MKLSLFLGGLFLILASIAYAQEYKIWPKKQLATQKDFQVGGFTILQNNDKILPKAIFPKSVNMEQSPSIFKKHNLPERAKSLENTKQTFPKGAKSFMNKEKIFPPNIDVDILE